MQTASVFIAVLGLVMIPFTVAPPKRNFEQGQKEMQQVSDNMTPRRQLFTAPRESVSVRTELLLREAHEMLNDINSNKKRFWLEAFAFFLENMLNKVNPDRKFKSNVSIGNLLQNFVTKESLNANVPPLASPNLKRRENFVPSFATIPPPINKVNEPDIPTKSKSMKFDDVTFTSHPESTGNSKKSPVIASLETSKIQTSLPSPESQTTNNQELNALQKFKEIHVPQDLYDVSISSHTNVPKESLKVIETSEISSSQEHRGVNEYPEAKDNHQQSSSSLPQSSGKYHYLPNLATPVSSVPETSKLQVVKLTSTKEENLPAAARAFDVLENHINSQDPSKYEWANNHLQEINYIDELQKELMEVARVQALERAQNNSPVSVKASDISPSTTTNQRNSFEQINEKPTLNENLPKFSSLPQSTEDSPLRNSVTALYHAVPDATSHQDVQVAIEAQLSLPKIEQDIPIQIEQEVTTNAITQTNNEKRDYIEDELVRELEELPRLVAIERARAPSTLAPSVNPNDTLTPATTKRKSFVTDYRDTNEEEKRKIEINLAQEIRELRHLGAKEEKIIEALRINRLHLPGTHELEKIGQVAGIHDAQNSNSDKTATYKLNPNTWKTFTHPYTQQPYLNDTYGGKHTNLPHVNVLANQNQGGYRLSPYYPRIHVAPRNIQNMLHKLQRENYLLKTRLMTYTQANENVNKMRGLTYPGPNPMNSFLPHDIRYPTEFSLNPNIQSQRSMPINLPYPYTMNSDSKNFTMKEHVGKETSLIPKPLTQNTASEFTDEMKRELRDGKVILLSDSVVRSNFDNEKEGDGKEKTPSEVSEAQVPAENENLDKH